MANPGDIMRQRKLMFAEPTTLHTLLNAFENQEEWLSRAQICGRVFRRVTPRLIQMIEEMVDCGELVKSTEPLPNGYKKYWYRRAIK